MDIFLSLVFIGGLVLIIWGFFAFLFALGRALSGTASPVTRSTFNAEPSRLEQYVACVRENSKKINC